MKETEKTGNGNEKSPRKYRKLVYPAAFFMVGILWVTFGF